MNKSVAAGVIALVLAGLAVVGGFWIAKNDSTEEPSTTSTKQTMQTSNEEDTSVLQGTKLADFQPLAEVTELQKTDLVEGTGEVVPEGATITAHYTGALASNGTIFQSSHDLGEPVQFSLNGVIAGWTQGVPGMKVGGKRRLIIPAELAYGNNPRPGSGIPPGAALVFDIELVAMP